MRMWMVDPRLMCRKHLLGEHVEIHMFVGSINKGLSMEGYYDNNLLEAISLRSRHDDLVEEMKRRGYNHKSPLPEIDMQYVRMLHLIDREAAQKDLFSRCPDCGVLHGHDV